MVAQVDVLTVGYAGERVAGTVVAVRDGETVIVIDPGMVAGRGRILDPLFQLGLSTGQVTDVVFSHHHPDHTLHAALFENARVHDFQATYHGDEWIDREFAGDEERLSPSVRLLLTPGHTPQDLSTLVDTENGLVVCTHLWWTEQGPADDPFAPDRETLRQSRQKVLDLHPALIIPAHGPAFAPRPHTPL